MDIEEDNLAMQFQYSVRMSAPRHCALCKFRKADIYSIIDPTLCKNCRTYVCHFKQWDTEG